jgi:hypothetical protein
MEFKELKLVANITQKAKEDISDNKSILWLPYTQSILF